MSSQPHFDLASNTGASPGPTPGPSIRSTAVDTPLDVTDLILSETETQDDIVIEDKLPHRKGRSWIWDHFVHNQMNNTVACKRCAAMAVTFGYKAKSYNTSTMAMHLKQKHDITPEGEVKSANEVDHYLTGQMSKKPRLSFPSRASGNTMGLAKVVAVYPDGTPLNLLNTCTALDAWPYSGTQGTALESRIFYDQDAVIAAVGVGKKELKSDVEKAELSRKIAAIGAKALNAQGSRDIHIDPIYSAHAAATGATLATFNWSLKTSNEATSNREPISFSPLGLQPSQLDSEMPNGPRIGLDWETGTIFAQAQNLARDLMETPANLCTPSMFAERIQQQFSGLPNVKVQVHDKTWAQGKGMRAFLSVAAGSDEPCKFIKVIYKGSSSAEFKASLGFVGKGITFDSGGISLKQGSGMKLMRADMGGAATVMSAAWAIAKLKIPIDLVVCTPLTENMPSGKATRPGDIITAMNGKTIEVDNTDAEGRLVLSDALHYVSSVYKPATLIDVATLTGAMAVALGEAFAGVFSTSDTLWQELEAAGNAEGDLFWRMPFSEAYLHQINHTGADLCNTGGKLAGSCTAAIFLREFVHGLACNARDSEEQQQLGDSVRYAHIDIAGVMERTINPESYNIKGMTGRPTRALIEFARQHAALTSHLQGS